MSEQPGFIVNGRDPVTGSAGRGVAIAVRRLVEADAPAFRALQLEAVQRHPDAFAADYAEESTSPLASFAARLVGDAVFGGFRDGDRVAMATLQCSPRLKRRHVAMVWGMYVRPAQQGTGAAARVFSDLLAYAEERADQVVELFVELDNARARDSYRKFGFRPYGVMHRALRVDGIDHDAEMLVGCFR